MMGGSVDYAEQKHAAGASLDTQNLPRSTKPLNQQHQNLNFKNSTAMASLNVLLSSYNLHTDKSGALSPHIDSAKNRMSSSKPRKSKEHLRKLMSLYDSPTHGMANELSPKMKAAANGLSHNRNLHSKSKLFLTNEHKSQGKINFNQHSMQHSVQNSKVKKKTIIPSASFASLKHGGLPQTTKGSNS